MLIEIEHELRFEYDDFIRESCIELRVEPLSDRHQTLRSFYLAVGPPTRVSRYVDWNGNLVHNFGVTDYHDRIEILTRCAVETEPPPVTLSDLGSMSADATGLEAFFDFSILGGPVEHTPKLEALVAALPVTERAPLGEQIAGIGHYLFEHFEYRRGVTDYHSTTQQILTEGGGVCQDFAHVMLGVLRLRHIPCRYVSGYLHVEGDEPSQSHAWVEVYAPGHGWVAFDPTQDCIPDERYVVLARGRHYDDVPPNRGVYHGHAQETLHASIATRVAPPKDVASLQQEIGQLDVPVFREQPRAATDPPGAEVEAQQQQQQ